MRTDAERATTTIEREVFVQAPPNLVFTYFTDPAKLTRWLAEEATLDPRPGGDCIQVHAPDDGSGRFHMQGTFVEVAPPERVVFTWGFTDPEVGVPPGSTTVEVTLTAEAGGTRLRLVHHGLPAAAVESHTEGWTDLLERVAALAAADARGEAG
jgi:uncharacterized protein YndB with AHSA1/START domain